MIFFSFRNLQQPRKVLLEQLGRVLPSDAEALPESLVLANTCDRQGAHVAAKLAEAADRHQGGGGLGGLGGGLGGLRVVFTAGPADVRAALTCLVARMQKYCNTQATATGPPSVKVALVGSDAFVNSLLRPYVDLFSTRPPDWQGYLRFYVIPLGEKESFEEFISA